MTADACAVRPAAPFLNPWTWPALASSETTLPNGLRMVCAEDRTVPLAFVSWTSQAGFEADPDGREGLASFTPLLLREGTARRSGREITRALDALGTSLWAGAEWGVAFLNAGVLSCDLEPAIDLLLEMACTPRFSDEAVARLRQRHLAQLEQRSRDLRSTASDAFARALFGTTGYGRPSLGTPETVRQFEPDVVAAFHAEHYQASRSCVTVAGSFDAAAVVDYVARFPMPPAGRMAPAAKPPSAGSLSPRAVTVVDVPSATQTELRIGQTVFVDREIAPRLELLSTVLGDSMTGRLAERLRRVSGVTYYVRSRVVSRRLARVFSVETCVPGATVPAVLAAIRDEIERLRHEIVPRDELERSRRRLLGAELRFMQNLTSFSRSLGPAVFQGDHDYLTRRRQVIASAEPDDLRELAHRSLCPDRLVAVVVGPAAALPSQFSSDAAASLESRS